MVRVYRIHWGWFRAYRMVMWYGNRTTWQPCFRARIYNVIQNQSSETSRALASSSLARSLSDLIEARVARFTRKTEDKLISIEEVDFEQVYKSAFTLSFSCKSPPEWISSHLLNRALLSLLVSLSFASEIGLVTCSQTINKHISTQKYATLRSEASKKWRNMRVRNCQWSQFGFVARQLRGHLQKKYRQIWPP